MTLNADVQHVSFVTQCEPDQLTLNTLHQRHGLVDAGGVHHVGPVRFHGEVIHTQ